jgi:hypothetical protein
MRVKISCNIKMRKASRTKTTEIVGINRLLISAPRPRTPSPKRSRNIKQELKHTAGIYNDKQVGLPMLIMPITLELLNLEPIRMYRCKDLDILLVKTSLGDIVAVEDYKALNVSADIVELTSHKYNPTLPQHTYSFTKVCDE